MGFSTAAIEGPDGIGFIIARFAVFGFCLCSSRELVSSPNVSRILFATTDDVPDGRTVAPALILARCMRRR